MTSYRTGAHICCGNWRSGGGLALPQLHWAVPLVPLKLIAHSVTLMLGLPSLLLLGGSELCTTVVGLLFHGAITSQLPPINACLFSLLLIPLHVMIVPGTAA